MKVKFKIQRFDSNKDTVPYFKEYEVDVEPTDRVVDALNKIKWYVDGTLTFRRSCVHGVCGSDAMRINDVNRLACKVLIKNLKYPIVIKPLAGLKVIKDLVVDMDEFFAKYKKVKPYFVNDETPPEKERLQSQKERSVFDDTTKCILCASCTTSCPSFWADDEYIGPAAIVNAHRFLFDSRDKGKKYRLAELNKLKGVWKCRTIFNCVDACPRDIDITKAISQVKRALLFKKFDSA